MKGLIRKAAIVLGCTLGASGVACDSLPTRCGKGGCGSAGATTACCGNKDLYDRCYPERYNNLAQREVNRAFTPQVVNGHVLDQTVWNHHFESGTDRLTPGGLAHLQHLSRRRPEADCTIYLATGLDLSYDPNCPERYAGARQELDTLRTIAIKKYVTGLNAGRAVDFQVVVHDPADVSIPTGGPGIAVQQMAGRFRGGLPGGPAGGGGSPGPAGAVGGFASGGGAAGGAPAAGR